ncbi:PhzF family phenazine biosynthesis protein [Alkalicaulis satelles]|uniref:PhzF family phenazine biosynthesis protein n=1 Tax=Alkalicaulis satelles TaxID=2609175 RepID=A0A5M6ZJ21_9PROT|nr:PhzF family phenazine biosynthesis protein [Alkalicaulis satelles]KAA5804005.1 PhzF family phenazine biosynthesis protein [Alkalicaulis satelles]
MELAYAEIHAFPDADRPHSGNPAGVVWLDAPLADADLLGIARSNNLSETAYLSASGEADAWGLRWFTPEVEVDLCGHATLASAAFLFEGGHVTGPEARFDTRSGRLSVTRLEPGRYAMDLPVIGWRAGEAASEAVKALGAGTPQAAFEVERVHGARYQMLVFESEDQIAALRPDTGALKRAGINVIATARGRSADVVSRFFAPASGVDEDPVTGSAHCTLAPYWAGVLGRGTLTARQIGPRPGALTLQARPDGRVVLTGGARRYLDGVIRI